MNKIFIINITDFVHTLDHIERIFSFRIKCFVVREGISEFFLVESVQDLEHIRTDIFTCSSFKLCGNSEEGLSHAACDTSDGIGVSADRYCISNTVLIAVGVKETDDGLRNTFFADFFM